MMSKLSTMIYIHIGVLQQRPLEVVSIAAGTLWLMPARYLGYI